jgi:hypothetical protein
LNFFNEILRICQSKVEKIDLVKEYQNSFYIKFDFDVKDEFLSISGMLKNKFIDLIKIISKERTELTLYFVYYSL